MLAAHVVDLRATEDEAEQLFLQLRFIEQHHFATVQQRLKLLV